MSGNPENRPELEPIRKIFKDLGIRSEEVGLVEYGSPEHALFFILQKSTGIRMAQESKDPESPQARELTITIYGTDQSISRFKSAYHRLLNIPSMHLLCEAHQGKIPKDSQLETAVKYRGQASIIKTHAVIQRLLAFYKTESRPSVDLETMTTSLLVDLQGSIPQEGRFNIGSGWMANFVEDLIGGERYKK